MASDARTTRNWLEQTTKRGVARYAKLTLRAHELAGLTVLGSWPAAEVAALCEDDCDDFADALWEQMCDHTAEARKHGKYSLTWWDKEGSDVGSKAVRTNYHAAGGQSEDPASVEGMVANSQKHAEFMAGHYQEGMNRAFEAIAQGQKAQRDANAQTMALLERFLDREVAVMEREAAAAETQARVKGETDSDLLLAQAKAELLGKVGEVLADHGAGAKLIEKVAGLLPSDTKH